MLGLNLSFTASDPTMLHAALTANFVVSTTTAQAGPVYRHMEFARQCLWPGRPVDFDHRRLGQFSVVGPNARKLIERVVDRFDHFKA